MSRTTPPRLLCRSVDFLASGFSSTCIRRKEVMNNQGMQYHPLSLIHHSHSPSPDTHARHLRPKRKHTSTHTHEPIRVLIRNFPCPSVSTT